MAWFRIDDPEHPAPDDCLHVRGLWVNNIRGSRVYWQAYVGYIHDETGEFLTVDQDDTGWRAEDFSHWMPLPAPPEAD